MSKCHRRIVDSRGDRTSPDRDPTTSVIITTPPDEQGWQVTYTLGVQGYDVIVMSVTEQSLIGVPAGGLTASRSRALLKPGARGPRVHPGRDGG